jgi:GDP-L-fucose synthase
MKTKILVTGGSGLLGKSLNKIKKDFLYLSSKDVNLINKEETYKKLKEYDPEIIIHLAGKVGGIKDNSENPYDFIHINNAINTNVIDFCVKNNTKIIFASSTCVYPKFSESYPMTEDMVNFGEPESTNDAYAYAKRFARNMLVSASKQYKLNYTVLYFCNLYGEYDDFLNTNKSHLVTSLIQKFHDAKINKKNKVVLWGTGKPMRQFMHSHDAANIIDLVVKNNIVGEFNVAIEENLTVEEISNVIKTVIGYTGDIEFNGNLDGVYRKDVSSKKLLNTLGGYKFLSLKEGIEKTYKSFLEKYYVEVNA